MCEHTGSGNDDDSQEPYLPRDGEENGGYRVTLKDGQVVYAVPRVEQPVYVQEGLWKEMKKLGFRVNIDRITCSVTISKKNDATIAKLINDGKLIYALDRVPE